MPWNVGVLIIGSLYWDNKDGREDWRARQLVAGNESLVKVPIRYGRKSRERKETYTMVFAPGLHPDDYGKARVKQCRGPISFADGLVLEARQLWIAESKGHVPAESAPQISGHWGCVALLVSSTFLTNPDSDAEKANRRWALSFWAETFCQEWQKRKKGKHKSREGAAPNTVYAGGCEAPVAVDENGLLQIPWPKSVDGNEPLAGFDLLLATVTTPTCNCGAYPTVDEIADAWKAEKEELYYFTCNQRNEITTCHDAQIKKLLSEAPKKARK